MMKKIYSLLFLFVFSIALCSCGEKSAYKPISGLDLDEKVSLKIAKYNAADPALDYICNEFTKRYSNVTIDQVYYENYDVDALKSLRLNKADIAFANGIDYSTFRNVDEAGNTVITNSNDYYLDFLADGEIDLSTTTDKLMSNYVVKIGDEKSYLYCLPVGGELRGLYVNVTFLNSLGVAIPTNWSEFLDCCEKISNLNYVPIQGNPSTTPTNAFLADAANSFVHDEAKLAKFRNCEDGAAELLRDTFEKVYTLSVNRYYDYKFVEEKLNQFKGASAITNAYSFLGLSRNTDTLIYNKPENNIGYTAFFPYLNSFSTTLDYLIDEYSLDTEYKFIMTPVGEESASSYMTPYRGIVGNKNSENVNWVREFVNFLMNHDNNIEYANREGIVPNVKECMSYIAEKYSLDENNNCASCGDILFPNYNAFNPIANALVDTAKCNALKYMIKLEKDASGNIIYYTDENNNEYLLTNNGSSSKKILKQYVGDEDTLNNPGYAFIKLDYFMDNLEASIAAYRG